MEYEKEVLDTNKKRIKVFKRLAKQVMLYLAEIWSWIEQNKLKSVQDRYLRWKDKQSSRYTVVEANGQAKITSRKNNSKILK